VLQRVVGSIGLQDIVLASFALVLFAFVPAASGLLSLPPFDALLVLIQPLWFLS
jgi:hypothetical protein